jgi:hypothetical protein
LLHSPKARPPALSEAELRTAIEDAIAGRKGMFLYDPKHVAKHNVSIQDILHVCHTWTAMTVQWDQKYVGWRYLIEGLNLSEKWMRVVIAVNTFPSDAVVAVTGFRYSRGKKKT